MTFYSQFGEDYFLDLLFPHNNGVYIEVGADNGLSGRSTYFFEKKRWNCVCIEPIKPVFD